MNVPLYKKMDNYLEQILQDGFLLLQEERKEIHIFFQEK